MPAESPTNKTVLNKSSATLINTWDFWIKMDKFINKVHTSWAQLHTYTSSWFDLSKRVKVDEIESHALWIQSLFRGYTTRKEVERIYKDGMLTVLDGLQSPHKKVSPWDVSEMNTFSDYIQGADISPTYAQNIINVQTQARERMQEPGDKTIKPDPSNDDLVDLMYRDELSVHPK